MKLQIVRIGNSRGIILTKAVLDQYGFRDKLEMIMQKDHVILKPIKPPREGWDKEFKRMHEEGDDELLFPDKIPDNIIEEWEW